MSAAPRYRRGVGVMLLDAAGRVFVGRRVGMADGWQMPQGGIDGDERPHDAALRELEEEVGTRKAAIIAETKAWHRYDLPAAVSGKLWGGNYVGQEQKWFLMRFLGDDRDIDLNHDRHPEFDAWRWVAPADLPGLIVAFKRPLYQAVLEEFAPRLVPAKAARVKR